MDKVPPRPGAVARDTGLRPADALRRMAMGTATACAAAPMPPPTSGVLRTLGEEEEMSDAPTPASIPANVFARPAPRSSIAASSWQSYWDKKLEVHLPNRDGAFNVYMAGNSGPVVICVHGGGYSGLTWSLLARRLKDKYRIVAPDMRGHGLTTTTDDTDFSKQTMSEDIIAIWEHLFGRPGTAGGGSTDGSQASNASDGPPASILVGHSMGGGLAVWAGAAKRIRRLEGVIVIDVVEGTALAALPHMMNILSGRPSSFASLDDAISWALRNGMCRNKEAAAVSMPGQLVQRPGQEAGGESVGRWTWRTALELSRPHWEGWYSGLSEAFLQLPCPKALVLAGTDRLDKALTIGQMQGKFQLILMPNAGHAIQEDEPDRTAEHVLGFLRRFRVGEAPLQFPRAPAGTRVVLPVAAGPIAVNPVMPPTPATE